jgi:hypothetical protein
MRTNLLALLCVLSLAGCPIEVIEPDGGTPPTDGPNCPSLPDLMPQPPACPAARGLTGDNLLCEDFANAQTTLAALAEKGWNFSALTSGTCTGWQISSNLLQVNSFSTLNGSCGLNLPPTTAQQILSYKHLTLSIQHRLDLSEPQQQTRIFLNDDTDAQNVLWQDTAVRNVPRQRTVITIDSADLPTPLKSGFKWFLKATSAGPFPLKGWQIESIAVLGEP